MKRGRDELGNTRIFLLDLQKFQPALWQNRQERCFNLKSLWAPNWRSTWEHAWSSPGLPNHRLSSIQRVWNWISPLKVSLCSFFCILLLFVSNDKKREIRIYTSYIQGYQTRNNSNTKYRRLEIGLKTPPGNPTEISSPLPRYGLGWSQRCHDRKPRDTSWTGQHGRAHQRPEPAPQELSPAANAGNKSTPFPPWKLAS